MKIMKILFLIFLSITMFFLGDKVGTINASKDFIGNKEFSIDNKLKSQKFPNSDSVVATKYLIKSCPIIMTVWPEIKEGNIIIAPAEKSDDNDKLFGWKNLIMVTIHTLKGEELSYILGGGNKPGVLPQSQTAQAACGLKPTQKGFDAFVSVPELAFLE